MFVFIFVFLSMFMFEFIVFIYTVYIYAYTYHIQWWNSWRFYAGLLVVLRHFRQVGHLVSKLGCISL